MTGMLKVNAAAITSANAHAGVGSLEPCHTARHGMDAACAWTTKARTKECPTPGRRSWWTASTLSPKHACPMVPTSKATAEVSCKHPHSAAHSIAAADSACAGPGERAWGCAPGAAREHRAMSNTAAGAGFIDVHRIAVEHGERQQATIWRLTGFTLALASAGALALRNLGDQRPADEAISLIYAPLLLALLACLGGIATRSPIVPNPRFTAAADQGRVSQLEGLDPWHYGALIAGNENHHRGWMITWAILSILNAVVNFMSWTSPSVSPNDDISTLFSQNYFGVVMFPVLTVSFLAYMPFRLFVSPKPKIRAALRNQEMISVEVRRKKPSRYRYVADSDKPRRGRPSDTGHDPPGRPITPRPAARWLGRAAVSAGVCAIVCCEALQRCRRAAGKR